MVAAIEFADRAVLVSVIPLSTLVHGSIDHMVAFALVQVFIGAPLATAWITWATRAAVPAKPARSAEHEAAAAAAAATVANALLTVSEAVSRLTRLDEILENVVDVAPLSIGMGYRGIGLWAQGRGKYVRAVTSAPRAGEGRVVATGLQIDPEQVPDFEWVRRLGHCVVVPVGESLQVAPVDVPAVLIAPLASGANFFGVMEFAHRNPVRGFTQRDMTIADGIARQTAVAIERARLVEESRRLVRAVEGAEEAGAVNAPPRQIIYANGAFMRTLGYLRHEVIGRDVLEIAGELPEPFEQFQETLLRRSWRGETVVRRRDGTQIPILLNASLIRDADGRILGAVAIVDDISEEKRFQEQMHAADRLPPLRETAAGPPHPVHNT